MCNLADTGITNDILCAFEAGERDLGIGLFEGAGGELFALFHGYENLEKILSVMPEGLWREHESFLGAYMIYLAKHGRAGRAMALLNDPELIFERTFKSDLFALFMSIHLGDPVSTKQLNKWINIERRLPLANPLLEGLFYNCMLAFFVQHGRIEEARIAGTRAITAFRDANHQYLEHFIHLHLADLSIMEGRLRDARRHLNFGIQLFRASGQVYGNEEAIIEIIQLTLDYETGHFEHIPARAETLRRSLLAHDSWATIYVQLARITVKSVFFLQGRNTALAELEKLRTGYTERHGGVTEVLAALEVSIDRLDGRLGDAEVGAMALDPQKLHSPIGQTLLREVATQEMEPDGTEVEFSSPRTSIVDALQHARQEAGHQRRRLVEKAFWLAVKEAHAAPFIEHRDVLTGIGARLSSGRFARGHIQLARLARRTVDIIRRSYWMPAGLRDLNITYHQYRVVTALQSGASNKEIARSLAVSEATIKYHLAHLYRVFGVKKRGELVEKFMLIQINHKN
ncbi:LuxR C-terminal-related transcriptional regulator [uncultured Maritalea sp.]|uniref:LuxR C-terminal-related transcriptional regulator n=1 Tax=uncultured Maritalea sp. TaxID=757249 RepID=UPI0026365137|nr:LuxR C-terminal-related transcriptional regulator [uncultured Maritalea sp.]